MINIFARILEYTWLIVSIAGIIITIHNAITISIVSSLKYAGLTIISILMYVWRKKRNTKLHK